MKKVEYFTIINDKDLLIVYENGQSSVLDLCLLFNLELKENKEKNDAKDKD